MACTTQLNVQSEVSMQPVAEKAVSASPDKQPPSEVKGPPIVPKPMKPRSRMPGTKLGRPSVWVGGGGVDPRKLERMTVAQLKTVFQQVFGASTTSNNLTWLRKKLAEPRRQQVTSHSMGLWAGYPYYDRHVMHAPASGPMPGAVDYAHEIGAYTARPTGEYKHNYVVPGHSAREYYYTSELSPSGSAEAPGSYARQETASMMWNENPYDARVARTSSCGDDVQAGLGLTSQVNHVSTVRTVSRIPLAHANYSQTQLPDGSFLNYRSLPDKHLQPRSNPGYDSSLDHDMQPGAGMRRALSLSGAAGLDLQMKQEPETWLQWTSTPDLDPSYPQGPWKHASAEGPVRYASVSDVDGRSTDTVAGHELLRQGSGQWMSSGGAMPGAAVVETSAVHAYSSFSDVEPTNQLPVESDGSSASMDTAMHAVDVRQQQVARRVSETSGVDMYNDERNTHHAKALAAGYWENNSDHQMPEYHMQSQMMSDWQQYHADERVAVSAPLPRRSADGTGNPLRQPYGHHEQQDGVYNNGAGFTAGHYPSLPCPYPSECPCCQ